MCAIIDASVLATYCANPKAAGFGEVDRWLTSRNGRIVYGGTKYGKELERVDAARQLFAGYARAGKAKLLDNDRIDADAAWIAANQRIKSDDEHILALARVSGARVLCTSDGDLVSDFTDTALVPTPKGRVFPGDGWNFRLDHRGPCGVRARR